MISFKDETAPCTQLVKKNVNIQTKKQCETHDLKKCRDSKKERTKSLIKIMSHHICKETEEKRPGRKEAATQACTRARIMGGV